jgi:hypothetical protein
MEPEGNPADKAEDKQDRRRELRHKVDGSAVLNLVYLGIRMPGRVLDLSLGGCCIQTDERFRLGVYRRVEVELQIEGLPFRLAGVTQSIHDSHRVGVRFLNVSDRKRVQLVQFIEDLNEYLKARHAGKEPHNEDAPGPKLVPPPEKP